MITTDTNFTLNNVVSRLCMRHLASGATLAVLAEIAHRNTGNREGPPNCCNGYKTDYLPLAKGHLVALELGGSDHPHNVVPQFEHWQGKRNGEWRRMELELRDQRYMGCHMLVEVGYGRPGPNEPYESAFDAFQANKIRDWNDSRIPDGFRVRVWPSPVARINITDDGSFAHALQQLATTPPLYDKVFALGTAMPQPDRGMYITQFALGAATDLHVGAMRDDSLVDYLLEPNSMNHVRQQVQGMAGVTPVEAAGLQAFPIMCAYQVGLTAPKVRKKIFERETANLPMANLADIGLPSTARRAAPKRKGDDARPDAAKQPRRE